MSELHHCLLERERIFIFEGLKQMVALVGIRIKQLEVKTIYMYVCILGLNSSSSSVSSIWPSSLELKCRPSNLGATSEKNTKQNPNKKPTTNNKPTKTPQNNPWFFLLWLFYLFVFECDHPDRFCTAWHSEAQRLEFPALASCHMRNKILSGGCWGFTPNKGSVPGCGGGAACASCAAAAGEMRLCVCTMLWTGSSRENMAAGALRGADDACRLALRQKIAPVHWKAVLFWEPTSV